MASTKHNSIDVRIEKILRDLILNNSESRKQALTVAINWKMSNITINNVK